MDVVALHQHGVDYAVATLGTSTTPMHVAKLLKLADELFFCFDGDAAGRKAAWRALENSLEQLVDGKQVSFMFFPDGEDPDSYVRKCAQDDVWKALPLSEFMLSDLAAQVDMATVEGRARFLDSAKPLLAKIVAPGLSLQLRRRLAKMAEVTVPELEELFKLRPVVSTPVRTPERRYDRRPAPASLTRWILQAVLSDPSLAARIDTECLDPADRYYRALESVLGLIVSRPGIGARDIGPIALEEIREGSVAQLLREVQAESVDAERTVSAAELASALVTLRDRLERRRITELVGKAQRSGNETAELERLQRTVSQRAKELTAGLESRV
jgi:DNA primase